MAARRDARRRGRNVCLPAGVLAGPARRSPCCPGRCRRRSPAPGCAPAGITVMLAMPPMFSATRPRRGVAEQQVIDEGHQRRALAAGGDIARAEIGDHRNAGALGEHAASPICSVFARRLRDRSSGRGSRSVRRSRAARRSACTASRVEFAAAGNSAARSRRCACRRSRPPESPARTRCRVRRGRERDASRRCARAISTMATSMPSSDVPLMIPATLIVASTPPAIRSAVAALRWAAVHRASAPGCARRSRSPRARTAGSAPAARSRARRQFLGDHVLGASRAASRISRARSITLSGRPASRATSMP